MTDTETTGTAPGKAAMPADKHQWRPSPLPGQVVLVTTVDPAGRPGVATKSWIAMVAFGPPPVLMFGCNLDHATARNALETGEFVVNVPGEDLLGACWNVGSDQGIEAVERFAANGLTPIPAEKVRPPRIAECRAHLECEVERSQAWGREIAIFGRIVSAAIDEAALEGDFGARYRALAPFFFLEGSVAAGLGPARSVAAAASATRPIVTILAVADVERSAGFYRAAFGWPARVEETPVYVELELPDGRGLGLYERRSFGLNTGQEPATLPPGALAGTEIYCHCDDLEAAIVRLETAGSRQLAPLAVKGWGDRAAYFADPDGNVLVLAAPI